MLYFNFCKAVGGRIYEVDCHFIVPLNSHQHFKSYSEDSLNSFYDSFNNFLETIIKLHIRKLRNITQNQISLKLPTNYPEYIGIFTKVFHGYTIVYIVNCIQPLVMAQLVERPPHNRKVDGSSHGRVTPKTLKMVLAALLFWRSKNEKGVGKLNTRSYQWTSPPL